MNVILERLVDAIQQERIDILKLSFSKLYEDGLSADLNVKDILSANFYEKGTLLHVACQKGSVDAVRTLLQEGANPCACDSAGKFPLDVASNKAIKDAFIQACIQAICYDNVPPVTLFLEGGVSVNSLDCVHTGNSLLHWAVCFGNHSVVRLLLDRGAEVNSMNVHRVTPLFEAVIRGDLRITEELLNHGADPLICAVSGPHAGRSALELAEHSTLRKLLEQSTHAHVYGDAETAQNSLDLNVQKHVSGVEKSIDKAHSSAEHLPVVSVVTKDPSDLLWPRPQHLDLRNTNGDQRFVPQIPLRCCLLLPNNEKLAFKARHVAQKFMEELVLLGCHPQLEMMVQGRPFSLNQITLQIGSSVANGRQDAYQVHVSNDQGMLLFGSNPRALLYACSTAIQLLYLYQHDGIPNLRLVDWPSLPVRAFLLEVSTRQPLQPSVLMDLLRHLAKLKATHVFFFVHIDPSSSLPVYGIHEWRALVERTQDWLLIPGLVLEINCATDVPLSDLEDTIGQLFAIFPQDCALQLGPRLSARLLDFLGEDKGFVDILLDDSVHCHSVWNRLITTQPLQICADAMLRLLKEDFGSRIPICHRLQPVVYCLPGQEDATVTACRELDNFGLPYSLLSSSASWRGLSAGASAPSVVTLPTDSSCLGLVSAEWTAPSSSVLLTHHVSGLAAHLYALGLVWNGTAKASMADATTALDNHLLMRHSVCSVVRDLGALEVQICKQFSLSQESPCLTLLHQPRLFLQKWKNIFNNLPNSAQLRLAVRKLRQLRRNAVLRENHRFSRLISFTLHCAFCATQLLAGLQLHCDGSDNLSSMDDLSKMFASSLGRPIRTDLANELLLLEEESRRVWNEWYLESVSPPIEKMFGNLIELLLCDGAATP